MSEKKIPLMECFGPTIQGEGAVIGQQTYFLRFGLCDYKCTMCDSMAAVDPVQVKAGAEWLTEEEITEKFMSFYEEDTTKWITLSGGNPCIHDLTELVQNLKLEGFKIAVETQGTKFPKWLTMCDVITVSPKGPGMGEDTALPNLDAFLEYMFKWRPIQTNLKIVCFDQRDLEFAKLVEDRYRRYGFPMYLSLGNPYPPGRDIFDVGFEDDAKITHEVHMKSLVDRYKILFEDISQDPILSQMRFLPQWHVFVWGNEKGK